MLNTAWVAVLLLTLRSPRLVLAELNQWEFRDCPMVSTPTAHPVSHYRTSLLNLEKQSVLSSKFWFMFSGVTHNMHDCGLYPNQLYFVQQKAKDQFTFSLGDGTKSTCPGHHIELGQASYGLISCAQERSVAEESAREWWWEIPISYITIILISLAVVFVLIVIMGTVIGIVWRRRSRRAASLSRSAKHVAMRPIRGGGDDSLYI